MVLRASLGILIVGGAIIGLYNIVMSIYSTERGGLMKMTPKLLIGGCLMIFAAVFFVVRFLPWVTQSERPSDIFRHRSPLEEQGRKIFIQNGCSYCHSQYIRSIDWDLGAERDRPGRRLHPGPPSPAGFRPHRPGPFPGRGRASRRLASGPFHQPPVCPAGVAHAPLCNTWAGKRSTPSSLTSRV